MRVVAFVLLVANFAFYGMGAQAQNRGCEVLVQLDRFDTSLDALRYVAPEKQQETAAKLVEVIEHLGRKLDPLRGTVLLQINHEILSAFAADRAEIARSIARDGWASMAAHLESDDFYSGTDRLLFVQEALRCDTEFPSPPTTSPEQDPTTVELRAKGTLNALVLSVVEEEEKKTVDYEELLSVLMGLAVGIGTVAFFTTRKLRRYLKRTRRYVRHYCNTLVMLSEDGGEKREVAMVEVSRSGAKLSGFDLPLPGKEIELSWANRKVKAYVVWANANYAGVAFDRLIRIKIDKNEADNRVFH